MHLYEDFADYTACDLTFKTQENYNLYYNGKALLNKKLAKQDIFKGSFILKKGNSLQAKDLQHKNSC